jgi:beta-galactosidase/beta-glucuronidase
MHLKGPWEYEPVATDAASAPAAGTAKLPAAWQAIVGDFRGTLRFRRRFHRPTNLEPHERVCVVFDGLGGTARVAVNGQLLGTIDGGRTTGQFEITPLLRPNNELVVEIDYGADHARRAPGGLWGPVALEIHST